MKTTRKHPAATRHFGTRTLCLLMSLVMALSLVQVSVFATADVDTQAANQIVSAGGTNYYKANGDSVTTGTGNRSNYDVSVSKNVSATGTENLFNVTANVQFKDTTSVTTAGDAAVAVVLDTSGSMAYCAECGGEKSHSSTCKYYKKNSNNVTSEQSRLTAAKSALVAFLNDYGHNGKDAGGYYINLPAGTKRMVSLVTYAEYAYSQDLNGTASGKQYWINAADADQLDAAIAVITSGSITAGGGTNTQAGMQLAENLIKTSSVNSGISGISNKFAVLLTDGIPTYSCTSGATLTDVDQVPQDWQVTSGTWGTWGGWDNSGATAEPNETRPVETICQRMSGTDGVKLYGITYGVTSTIPNGNSVNVGINSWLEDTGTYGCHMTDVYSVNNPAGLSGALAAILNSTANVGTGASAVTDNMNATAGTVTGTEINFVAFTGNAASDTGNVTQTNGVISWNLSNATKDTAPATGWSSYTITYQVRLNNIGNDFVSGAPYSLDAARLTFTDSSDSSSHTAASQQPQVKGYTGSLGFTKEAAGDANILFGDATASAASAKFGIYDGETLVAAASTTNNSVSFAALPSGHTYTLKEIGVYEPNTNQATASKLFTVNGDTYTVTIAYGAVTVTDKDSAPVNTNNMTVTNNWDPQNMTFELSKQWNDSDATMDRPDSITVNVMRKATTGTTTGNAELYETVTLTAGGNWTTNVILPTHATDSDTTYSYYLTEAAVAGYQASANQYTVSGQDLTIINTRTANTTATVSKVWRTTESAANLTAKIVLVKTEDGTNNKDYSNVATLTGNTSQTFNNLPSIDGAKTYSYAAAEWIDGNNDGNVQPGELHTSGIVTIGGKNYTVGVNDYTVTNTLTQDNTVSLSGTKTWNIASYSGTPGATIALTGKVDSETVKTDTATVGSSDTSYSFTGLPKYAYQVGGDWTTVQPADASTITAVREIAYTVNETQTGDASIQSSQTGNNFTNTLTGTTSVAVTKVWVDNDNAEGRRPNSVTFDLFRNDEKTQTLTLNATETTATVEGSQQPAATYTWNTDDLTGSFNGLAKYDATGREYAYTVQEEGVFGYTAAVSGTAGGGYTFTNTLGTDSDKTSVSVTKVWMGTPGSATITLSGTDGSTRDVTLPTDSGANSYTFENLPVYVNGTRVSYTAAETTGSGYVSHVSGTAANGFTFTNTQTQDNTLSVSGTKSWVLNGSAVTPEATVSLQSDAAESGAYVNVPGKSATVNATNTTYSFTGLPKYAYLISGAWTTQEPSADAVVTGFRTINYKVTDAVDGFTTTGGTAADNYSLTNTFNQITTNVTGSKTWKDGGIDHSKDTVTVGLYQNDVWMANATVANGAYSFTDLPLYSAYNTQYNYTVKEMNGEQGVPDGGKIGSYTVSIIGYNITNTLSEINTSTVNKTITKLWIAPVTGRPDSVTVTLHRSANGTADSAFSQPVTLTAARNWTTDVTNLKALNDDGYAYTYSIVENGVTDANTVTLNGKTYDVSYSDDGMTVTNTIRQEPIAVTGTKTWDPAASAPATIKVQLFGDNNSLGDNYQAAVTAADSWQYGWNNLPRYYLVDTNNDGKIDTDGHEIAYSVKEVGETANKVQYGVNHFTVTYAAPAVTEATATAFRTVTLDITNTLASVDEYSYQVNANFTKTINGVAQPTVSVFGAKTTGTSGQGISKTISDYAVNSGETYTLASATLDNTTVEPTEGAVAWTLNQANHVYTLVLNFTLSVTRNDPIIVPEKPIPDPDVPLEPTPVTPVEPGTDITDPDVPQAGAAEQTTGDELYLWIALATASGMSLVWLTISGKKRRDENNK